MSFGPLLVFTKHVSHLDLAFLSDYVARLSMLHSSYQGLLLPGPSNTVPQKGEDVAEELLSLIETGTSAWYDPVCRHEVEVIAKCDSFSWDLSFDRFTITGGTFRDVFGSTLNEDDDFVSAYGSEEAFLAFQGPNWIEQGLSDSVSSLGKALSQVSSPWGIYLSAKNLHHYNSLSKTRNSLLDCWGKYPPEKRVDAGDFLESLCPRVNSYHPELFRGDYFSRETAQDHRTFVRYADERLLRHFGHEQFSAMLSEFDLSLDQWLAAGEPKPANYSVGGILLLG